VSFSLSLFIVNFAWLYVYHQSTSEILFWFNTRNSSHRSIDINFVSNLVCLVLGLHCKPGNFENRGLFSLHCHHQDINKMNNMQMEYKELGETRKYLQCHKEFIMDHVNALCSISEKISVQESNSNFHIELIVGILLQQKKHINTLETEIRELHHLIVQLCIERCFVSHNSVHSANSILGLLEKDNAVHFLSAQEETRKTVTGPVKEAKDEVIG
jgi:hypothetical protein